MNLVRRKGLLIALLASFYLASTSTCLAVTWYDTSIVPDGEAEGQSATAPPDEEDADYAPILEGASVGEIIIDAGGTDGIIDGD